MPAKNPLVNGETFPTPTSPDVSYLDFEDIGERIKNLLNLAMFVERARHLTGELEAAAGRDRGLRQALVDRGIFYADAYFDADESVGLQALLRHAHELAEQAKEAGMALAMAAREGAQS
jgi:hypothetical protein